MGGRTLLVSGRRVLDQKSNGQNSRQDKATWANHPPASFIYGRLPFRAAATPWRNLLHQRSRRTRLVAAWGLWAAWARGLSSGRFAIMAPCFCTVWGGIMEIPHQSPGWVSDFSGKAEKLSNFQISSKIMHERGASGRKRDIFNEIIDKWHNNRRLIDGGWY